MSIKRKRRPKNRRKRRAKFRSRIFTLILLGLLVFGLFKFLPLRNYNFKSSREVIVIDPGHGGRDSGAIGYHGTHEKDLNLQIANRLTKLLKKKGYRVISTRERDEYIDNKIRADMANKKKARVYISIHNNSLDNDKTTEGIQVLYYPNRTSSIGDLDNYQLAEIMMDNLIRGTGAVNKGVIKRPDLIVLNRTKMPAILIECGFLSNGKEEKLLSKSSYQKKIVNSILKGLEEYFQYNQ